MTGSAPSIFLWTPRRSPWRWPLAGAATLAGAAHLPVIGSHLDEAPYLAEEFVVLAAACLLLATAALVCDSAAVYCLIVLTCGLAVIGYVATRLVAFPQIAADVGDWQDPFGVVSIAAETLAVVAAIGGLRRPAARSSGLPAPLLDLGFWRPEALAQPAQAPSHQPRDLHLRDAYDRGDLGLGLVRDEAQQQDLPLCVR